MTPAAIRTLLKQGFREVLVEKGAGEASEFSVSTNTASGVSFMNELSVAGAGAMPVQSEPC